MATCESIPTEPKILKDGTLCITVPDYFRVKRVLVQDHNCWGDMFYKDDEQPRGEWIIEEKDCIYGKKIRLTCSECGDIFDVSESAFPRERFCRWCGARMVSDEHDK